MLTVNLPPSKRAYLVPLADIHVGDPGFNEELLRGYVAWIRECGARVILLGDGLDAPTAGNRASDVWERSGVAPGDQLEVLTELLKPISENIDAAIPGNHEDRIYRALGWHPTKMLLSNLGVSGRVLYDQDAVFVRYVVGSREFSYDVFAVHGWGGARKTGGHLNKAEELERAADADIYLVGHEHTLFYSRGATIMPNYSSLVTKRRVFVGCGCFVRLTRFQKRIARKPPDMGAPRIRLEGSLGSKGHPDVHVSF
jgi:hypothetical protein